MKLRACVCEERSLLLMVALIECRVRRLYYVKLMKRKAECQTQFKYKVAIWKSCEINAVNAFFLLIIDTEMFAFAFTLALAFCFCFCYSCYIADRSNFSTGVAWLQALAYRKKVSTMSFTK